MVDGVDFDRLDRSLLSGRCGQDRQRDAGKERHIAPIERVVEIKNPFCDVGKVAHRRRPVVLCSTKSASVNVTV